MLIDQADLDHTLQTMNFSRVMILGFEEEAFGAMLGLVCFRYISEAARLAWDRACIKSANSGPPTTGAFQTPRKSFYLQLMQQRRVAFGIRTALKDINVSEHLVANPWTLTDPEFVRCCAYVKNDDEPKLAEFEQSIIPENVKYVAEIGGPIVQKLIGNYLSSAAPELVSEAGMLMEGLSWPLLVAGMLSAGLQKAGEIITHRDNKRRYQIDGIRREYLTSTGHGIFRMADIGGSIG